MNKKISDFAILTFPNNTTVKFEGDGEIIKQLINIWHTNGQDITYTDIGSEFVTEEREDTT